MTVSVIIKKRFSLFSLIVGCLFLSSCVEELKTENFYTFTGETVTDFLENRPEEYSSFLEVLQRTGVSSLLDAYGEYTCFAPTNEAFETFLRKKGVTSISELTDAQCDSVSYSHIIKEEYLTTDLEEGIIPTYNMNYRYLTIGFITEEDGSLKIVVNKDSKFLAWDEEVENGIIHTIDKVLEPSTELLPELLSDIDGISLWYSALVKTGLTDSLIKYKDESYVAPETFPTYDRHSEVTYCPDIRLYGYTAFVETDSIFALNGITNLDELIAYAKSVYDETYPEDAGLYDDDFTHRKNPLNRFMAYHLLNRTAYYNKFVTSISLFAKYTPTDYFETMCPNTIMQVTTNTASTIGLRINRRVQSAKNINIQGQKIIGTSDTNEEQIAINGTFHYISDILTYNKDVRDVVLNTRMRMDAATMCPELMTNGMRTLIPAAGTYFLPAGYLDNMTYSEESYVYYKTPNLGFWCWQGDEYYAMGQYDFTLRLPPVPPGTYEVRLGYVAMGQRGIAQIYFGTEDQFKINRLEPVGIPLNLTTTGTDPKVGWIADTGDTETDNRNDRAMHNRGYMKGPDSNYSSTSNWIAREVNVMLRLIMTQRYLSEEPHYVRFRSVTENLTAEFMLDYIEFCPKSVYDNDTEKEDRH